MDRDGFMRDLTGLNKYMIVDESIVTIGISGISGISGMESRKESSKRHNISYIVRRRYGH
jgi:hypothetical protein